MIAKKYLSLLVLPGMVAAFLSFSTQVKGAEFPRVTIAQALELRDEARVSIEGSFIARIPGEEDEFTFRDSAGSEILVYAPPRARRQVVLNTPVTIFGRIDLEEQIPEISLKRVEEGSATTEEPELEVLRPKSGDVTTKRKRYVIRGTAEDATSVAVNVRGKGDVRVKGRLPKWRAVIRLKDTSPRIITVTASGPGGSDSETVIVERKRRR